MELDTMDITETMDTMDSMETTVTMDSNTINSNNNYNKSLSKISIRSLSTVTITVPSALTVSGPLHAEVQRPGTSAAVSTPEEKPSPKTQILARTFPRSSPPFPPPTTT